MPNIQLGDFQNGISQLGKMDIGKWFSMVNLDVHDNIGIAQPQKAMENESDTPDELCRTAIDPTGNVYMCSTESGKIWKRTTAGVYSLVHTNTNGSNRNCQYFNGFLWYWTGTKLGYFDFVSTWTDSFATFTNGKARGSVEANNTLLIGDGRDVARIDSSNVFSSSELTLPGVYNVTDMVNIGDDVLIGTIVDTEVAYCKVFKWNTIDTSWTSEDEIFEIGVNFFIQLDNIYIAQCGPDARFYYYDGVRMNKFGRLRGVNTGTSEQSSVNYKGRALFINNGSKVYSLHRESSRFEYAFCTEYKCTNQVSSMIVQGDDLLVSTSDGMNKAGPSYATATLISPEIQEKVSRASIKYDNYPAGIAISTKIQGEDWNTRTPIIDSNKREIYYDGGLNTNATFQAKITLTPVEQAYTNDPSSGSNIVLEMTDTSNFSVYDTVLVSSSAGEEEAIITAISEDTSITVGGLSKNHTTTNPLVINLPKITAIKIT